MSVLTPKQQKLVLKQRLQDVLLKLPPYFINTFLHVFPEYKEQRKHVYNVVNYRSYDELVIEKFEQFSEILSNPKIAH